MAKQSFLSFAFFLVCSSYSFAQTCTADADETGTNTINASTAGIWTASGGATCPPTSTFTGNVVINVGGNDTFVWDYALNMTGDMSITLANLGTMEFSADVNVTGNVPVVNAGSSTLQINSGADVHVIAGVNGDMGDNTNNNVTFVVNGTLKVDGTLSGKNSNGFSGSGSVSGGTLDLGNGATCGSPCPVSGGFSSCTAGGGFCTTYLPIVLSYFKVEVPNAEKHVLVEWGTDAEQNFHHFEIERAGSNLEFSSIVSVPGAGYNTSSLQKYSTYDENPLVGTSYYRLKAVDIDASFEYFYVRSVTYHGGRNFYISPNPSPGTSIKYSINFDPSPYDRVVLIDAVGNELAKGMVTGIDNELIPDRTLTPGPYLLRYISANYQQVARVFVKN